MAWSCKGLLRDALTRVAEISCTDLAAKLAQGVVLDVREHDEIAAGIIPDAVVVPRGVVERHIHEHAPDREKPIYVYSSTGDRSALVADTLKKMGYANVYSLAGGFERWRHDGKPVAGGAPAACRIPGTKLDWDEVR